MTEKLYYADSHIRTFSAAVTSCRQEGERWLVTLDRTAFFPEGGGQAADTGLIGRVRVLDVQEKNGEILHYTQEELTVGETQDCAIDWELRFQRMQGHSGEHIVSGLVHARFGYDNVGFHMGDDGVTMDFSGEISKEELAEIELAANRVIWENVPITTYFPDRETLAGLKYRSKLELDGDVRIVEIEGYDVCACCAPHVARTGEVGVIKFLDAMRHRGGIRITMLAGAEAVENYRARQRAVEAISVMLSAKRDGVVGAVERVCEELQSARQELVELKKAVLTAQLESVKETDGNLCFFETAAFDMNSLRFLVNEAVKRCGGIAAAFAGSDADGYTYVMGSRSVDLRAEAKAINSALAGRGGGSTEMIQGSVKAGREAIEMYFKTKEGI